MIGDFDILIAATAAGLDFSRINLIIGALGVGIGFGLQNVVNNFVSGLILLFERPIRVGDLVESAGYLGIISEIGIFVTMPTLGSLLLQIPIAGASDRIDRRAVGAASASVARGRRRSSSGSSRPR